MFLVSQLIDIACQVGGPKFAHRVHLKRLERWRTFESEFYLLDHLVDPARASIDVGANIGVYAGRMSQLSPKVHCFEPIPWLADSLRGKLAPPTEVHQIALSNYNGRGTLRIPFCGDSEFHGLSTLQTDNALAGSTRIQLVECDVMKLDDCIHEPVGFIKIDVEGHELAVIQGAENILREHLPVLLVESEHRHNASAPDSIFQMLEGLGYSGFFLKNNRPFALSAFRRESYQDPANLPDLGSKKAPEKNSEKHIYVNNFFFIPGAAKDGPLKPVE